MATVRRWYLFIVSLISLQSVTWVTITILHNLIASSEPVSLGDMTFQIAVILVGLPIFLVHWIWAQRLAKQDEVERFSLARHLYLYGTLAIFFFPFLYHLYDLVDIGLHLLLGETISSYYQYSIEETFLRNLIAMAILALSWLYHLRLTIKEYAKIPLQANIRLTYILIISAIGLGVTAINSISLLNWLMHLPTTAIQVEVAGLLTPLIIGLPLWLSHWIWAQYLFETEAETENGALLRKVYLYTAIFLSAFATVANATLILQGVLSRLFGLTTEGDIRDALSIIIVMSLLWAYHTFVLRQDGKIRGMPEEDASLPSSNPSSKMIHTVAASRQVAAERSVRRLYFYLVASIGLGAFLISIAGYLSLLIRLLDQQVLLIGLKEELTWFTSALIVGLPVWLLPWQQVQRAAFAEGTEGKEERHAIARKLYLYFYIFVATMTVLTGAVYTVQQLLNLLLGERNSAGFFSDVGQAIGFVLIAVGVWLYHGVVLRRDGQQSKEEEQERLSAWHVVVIDREEGRFGQPLLTRLRERLPGLSLEYISLTPASPLELGRTEGRHELEDNQLTKQLAKADLIISPWTIAASNLVQTEHLPADEPYATTISQAVANSSALKLLIPTREQQWEWVGGMSEQQLIKETVNTVKLIITNEYDEDEEPLKPAIIMLYILAAFLGLWLLMFFFAMT